MPWLKKNSDPVSDRAQALNAEIEALEEQIKKLDAQLSRPAELPRLRSTVVPPGGSDAHLSEPVIPMERTEPVFEQISQERITMPNEMPNAPEHFNEFGMRKFDFPGFVQRVRAFFSGPNTSNPRLVSYLAAGGVHGLQPLRKEKRVARNRFIFLAAFLFVLLFGTLWMYLQHR